MGAQSARLQVPGYRMLRALGRGGMGSVFLAEKIATREPVAIKFLRHDCMEDPMYFARFEREVAALRSIRHPNVVNVYGWWVPQSMEGDERPYVIMEYLEGEGLDRVLARLKKLEPLVAVRIMLQVLDGLAAAHAIGVVHRDLGPSNIFLIPRQRGRFQVKILDFGLARSLQMADSQSEVTQQGTLMGKPAYVAPEALLGQRVDGRCDIFACGVLLFRMLTGTFPYKDLESHLLWVERLRDARALTEYPPPRAVDPDVPQALDQIVQRAMRVKVEDRYATVEQMQEDLVEAEALLAGHGPGNGDWSSASPGIPRLGESSSSSVLVAPAPVGVDAAPTTRGVVPQVTTGPAVSQRSRKLLVVDSLAACLVLVVVAVTLALRGRGEGARPTAATGADVTVASVAHQMADAGGQVKGFEVKPDVAATKHAEPDASTAKQAEPQVAPAQPRQADVAELQEADATPRTVRLVLRGLPSKAVARFGNVRLTGSPPSALVPAEVESELVIEARGYQTYRRKLALTADREMSVRMQPERPPPPRDAGRIVSGMPWVPEDPF